LNTTSTSSNPRIGATDDNLFTPVPNRNSHLLPAQVDPLKIAVGADAIAYVSRTDAVLEGYQVVVCSRAVAAPVAETVLPPVTTTR
jgi:hypothetical protein